MVITAIKQQVKRPDRYSIFIDGAFAFGLSEQGLLSSGLASGQELDSARLEALKTLAGTDKMYGNALRYVAMRPRSVWEVQTYLQRKEAAEEQITQLVDRLKAVNLLDDRAFADSWVTSRRILKPSSKRKLRVELQQKHVPSSIIDTVLHEDETDDRTTLREVVAKKHSRYPDRAKFMQYLARQGYSYDDIKSVLDELPDPDIEEVIDKYE